MPSKKNVLPPLDYLLAFEAAAKGQSFVKAAADLNLSETAISRKVRLLEQHFGAKLFKRGHRSITLTAQGRVFYDQIQPPLNALRDVSKMMANQSHRARTVILAATNSVAALWLTPRLRELNKNQQHHNIMLLASDSDAECLSETVDLAILRGDGDWPGYRSSLLFGETIFPVCSPEYLDANPKAAEMSSLPGLDLIEVASHHTEWMNWREWMLQNGMPDPDLGRAMVFNTYPLSIDAAVDGLGVALGWAHLVDRHLDAGRLVRPLAGLKLRTNHGYYLLRASDAGPSVECDGVANWLLDIAATRKRYDQTSKPA